MSSLGHGVKWLFVAVILTCLLPYTSADLDDIDDMDIDDLADMMEMFEDLSPKKEFKPIVEPNVGDSLTREILTLTPEACPPFEESEIARGFTNINTSRLEHDSKCDSGECKARGSRKPIQKHVKPFDHGPDPDSPDVPCGNPVCVILDRRPMRFKSLCAFNSEARSRGKQVNYIQKGDCYDIIDGESGESKKQPWVSPEPVLQKEDCNACRKDFDCAVKVVISVDILSILNGSSSALGGDRYISSSSKKMPGIPLEFPNVCEAMIFFQSKKNLNFKTQVIGYALGTKQEIFPMDGNRCLWTEWFDYNSPCLTDGDLETHGQHKMYLERSLTGTARLCGAEAIQETQQQGGSVGTNLPAKDLDQGMWYPDSEHKMKQALTMTSTSIKCENSIQDKNISIPPPFEWSDDPYVKCLDYKQRYCCKSINTFRPKPLIEFSRFIEARIPIGPTLVKVVWNTIGDKVVSITLVVKNIFNVDKKANVEGTSNNNNGDITIEFTVGEDVKVRPVKGKGEEAPGQNRTKQSFSSTLSSTSGYVVTLVGFIYHNPLPNGGKEVDIQVLHNLQPPEENEEVDPEKPPTQNTGTVGEINIKLDGKNVAVETKVEDFSSGKSVTTYHHDKDVPGENEKSEDKTKPMLVDETGEQVNPIPGVFVSKVMPLGGEMKKVTIGAQNEEIISFTREPQEKEVAPEDDQDWWTKVINLNNEVRFDYFIEAPPLATLFAECRWKDWVNQDYPNKEGTGSEQELRVVAQRIKKLSKTVCGDIPENAHYIDAVTVETRVPWYELKDEGQYEVYKLTPYFGYACADANMPHSKPKAGQSGGCQDMKIRYCCDQERRAEWGVWGGWASCDKECGGGKQRRERSCPRKDGQKPCFGMNQPDRHRFLEQEKICNIKNCPVDFTWSPWASWSGCSASCGKGHRERMRVCHPAVGEGENCPEKKDKLDLFLEQMECQNLLCERFQETQWSSWSQISRTCGVGTVTSSRRCQNMHTFETVENRMCFPAGGWHSESHFTRTKDTKLQDCPVDGGWSEWQKWERCTQDCVPPPSQRDNSTSGRQTKAVQQRFRYCTNPMPRFQGRKCPRVEGEQYHSQDTAVEEKECRPLSEGGDLPYCPVNCVYSSWSTWSQCSATCVVRDKLKFWPEPQQAMDEPNTLRIWSDDHPEMPRRSRRQCRLRPAEHGGKCPQEDERAKGLEGSEAPPYIEEQEDCKLAAEHCVDEKLNPNSKDQFKWPAVDYPGNDSLVLGYCPMDCEWSKDVVVEMDCQKNQEREFMEQDANCYFLEFSLEINKWSDIEKLKDELIERMLNKEVEEHKSDNKDPKSMKKRLKSTCGRKGSRRRKDRKKRRSNACRKTRKIINAFKVDLSMVYKLTTRIITKRVVLPNLDGLYGGKPCKTQDGQETTKYGGGGGDDDYDYSGEEEEDKRRRKRSTEDDDDYKDGEEEGGEGGKFYGTEDAEIQLKACDLPICLAQPPEDDNGEFKDFPKDIQPPCIAVWTVWGKWGSCDMTCGAQGKRKRKRECVEHCREDEDKKTATGCREGSTLFNVNVTDTDTTSCRLCPPDKSGTWSTWSDWEPEEGFTCSDDEDAVTKYTRKRKCIPGAKDKKCPPGVSDKTSGYEEQSMEHDRPSCDGQDPKAWKQTEEERKENENMMNDINKELAKESGETSSPDPEEDPKDEEADEEEEEEEVEEY